MQNPSALSVLWFSYSSLIPGMYNIEHTHPFFHFGCLTSGKLIDRKSGQELPERWIYCAPAYVPHGGIRAIDEEVVSYECKFVVNDPQLQDRIAAFPFHKITLDKASEQLLKIIASDIKVNRSQSSLLDASFLYFINRLMDINSHLETQATEGSVEICAQIKKYIEENYMHEISLAQLAEEVNLSPNYTCHLFRKTTGTTIIEYLNRTRVKAACNRITYSSEPIKDIYRSCGFSDQHNFGRVFKQLVGIPPSAYRTTHDSAVLNHQETEITSTKEEKSGLNFSGSFMDLHQDTTKKGYFTYAPGPQKFIQWRNHYAYLTQEGFIKEAPPAK